MTNSQFDWISNLRFPCRSTTSSRRLLICSFPSTDFQRSRSSVPPAVPSTNARLASNPDPRAVPANQLPTSAGYCIFRLCLPTQPPTCVETCALRPGLPTNFHSFIGHCIFRLCLPICPPACAGNPIFRFCLRTRRLAFAVFRLLQLRLGPTSGLRRISHPSALPSNQPSESHRMSYLRLFLPVSFRLASALHLPVPSGQLAACAGALPSGAFRSASDLRRRSTVQLCFRIDSWLAPVFHPPASPSDQPHDLHRLSVFRFCRDQLSNSIGV